MFRFISSFLSLLCLATPIFADRLGTLHLAINGKSQRVTIDDSSAGVDTYWAVGPVSIFGSGGNGGTVLLTFDEDGTGAARAPRLTITTASGQVWQDVDGSLSVTLTRADNLPPQFAVDGSFAGTIEHAGKRVPVKGTFQVLLPRQDFAPTPPPETGP